MDGDKAFFSVDHLSKAFGGLVAVGDVSFAVEKGSPAVDRGTRLPPDWADVVPAGDGKPDIGAWEIGSTDVPSWGRR